MYNLVSKINFIMNNKILLCILGFVILYLSFYKNALGGANKSFFNEFQLDSEALVLANAFKDKEGIEHKFSNLGSITMKGTTDRIKQEYLFVAKNKREVIDIPVIKNLNSSTMDNDNSIFVDKSHINEIKYAIGYQIVIGDESRYVKDIIMQDKLVKISYFGEQLPQTDNSKISLNYESFGKQYIDTWEYTSQYGLQGKMTSFLFNKLDFSIKTIQKINVIVLSFVILCLTYLFKLIFSKNLAVCFFISVVFSPLVVSFAKNLYWIEFSWFLPSIFSWILYIKKGKAVKFVLYFGIYLSCCFKCLSGYEYFSSVLLFAVSPFLYSCLSAKSKKQFIENLVVIIKICLIGTCGFLSAVMMHAYLRTGGNIFDGLSIIWHNDVLRRTYGGNINNFIDPDLAPSFKATPFEVLRTYFNSWDTSVIRLPILKNISFITLISLCLFAITIEYARGEKEESRHNLSLIITFLIPAISWYILGKSHSYIHRPMNFVLWYMGGVGVILHIIYKEIIIHIKYEKVIKEKLM
ncbi:hypothetical protein [Succinivibrio faecicola]|uniref:Glycosyltransferase RgtA/B/C/D-like domain-containing protein n=1 Tax=Succinivibrio faecicola TaxID=2820300 RepID=A0ABS7DIA3_9GAMM|nr:hypothetical protein [Succinivibrio faecicola]MBW7571016.1 hypothetical protein [Succinivibrio faecicola]